MEGALSVEGGHSIEGQQKTSIEELHFENIVVEYRDVWSDDCLS